jgi:hypothetical protein
VNDTSLSAVRRPYRFVRFLACSKPLDLTSSEGYYQRS